MRYIRTALQWIWTALKFLGRWLGPALILLDLLLFLFPPRPVEGSAGTLTIIGLALSALALFLNRRSQRQTTPKVLAACVVFGFAFWGWSNWQARQGYTEETVAFDNDGARLVGTLYLSEAKAKVPGIVFFGGAGATPRSRYRPFGAHFAKAGYAFLIYDKRGVGDSTGIRESHGYFDVHRDMEALASDASAGLAYLASRPEVRADSTGLAGVSEGGLIAPRAAELNGHAAFLLAITAPTTSLFELVRYQTIVHEPGRSPDQAVEDARRWFGKDFDPVPSLEVLDIPGLWLFAGADATVPNDASMHILDRLRSAGKPYEYRLYPDAWHGLLFAPRQQAHDDIHSWLEKVTAGDKQASGPRDR